MKTNLVRMASLALDCASWDDGVRALPVTPSLSDDVIDRRVRAYDFQAPVDLHALVADVADLLAHGTLHATHPRYFGLFNPSVRAAGVIGDAVAAVFNPQVGAFWHAPAANAIERAALDFFASRAGFDPRSSTAIFTTGGSEANSVAVLTALTRRFPAFADGGARALDRRPVFYASEDAHDSLMKIAHATGIGRSAVRRVGVDARRRLDVGALAAAIARDRAADEEPFLVVGTAGTTGYGAIDPLPAIADLCAAEGLAFHVDAAWGGYALLSDRLRGFLRGIERADSITWDAHKTLPVPMGAGMFLARASRATAEAFHVSTSYVPDAVSGGVDLYQHSPQWSRRFIGLKVFLTLAELGAAGIADLVDRQTAVAALLRDELARAGWTIRSDTPLALVCFSHPELEPSRERVPRLLRGLEARGDAWLSEVRVPAGGSLLRACVTSHKTNEDDVRALARALDRELASLRR